MPSTNKFKLIDGAGAEQEFGLAPSDAEGGCTPLGSKLGRPLLRRPGDQLETIWVGASGELDELRAEARTRSVDPETAVAITIERRLIANGLKTETVDHLNQIAQTTRPELELWAAHSAYLGHLLFGRGLERASATPRPEMVALPIRIVDRAGNQIPPAEEPARPELDHALAWEVAALLNGETMGEWGYRCALEQLQGAP